MAKADLHVHSIYSEHPSEWFLQRVGAAESYTDPEFIYREAKKNGMKFVTITDHNRIDGAIYLKEKYPKEVFLGLEATAYFPEDGCKVHILIYGLNKKQFHIIQKVRTDVYKLREYIRNEDLAYSVAHATYSVNGKLTTVHLEKLILLFDNFEAVNGGRNQLNNESWMNVLENLTPQKINKIYKKHKIQPFGQTPWIKRFTGGSDDHAGLFIGKTWTEVQAITVEDFLNQIKRGKADVFGRHNDYQSLAFTIYKIAYEFSKSKSKTMSNSLFSQLTEYIFEQKKMTWKERFKLKRFKKGSYLKSLVSELIDTLNKEQSIPNEDKIRFVYQKIADISDEFLVGLFRSFGSSITEADFFKIVRNISSSLPGLFLTFPFFTTLKHMFKNRELLMNIQKEFDCLPTKKENKILWFSDTIDDLNGVAITVEKIRATAVANNRDLKVVGTKLPDHRSNYLALPSCYTFKLPYYEKLKINLPSILKSIELIYNENPDEIIISTPGPVGLVGFLAAKLLNIKCAGVYHTDFSAQAYQITNDEGLVDIIDQYINWFYDNMDTVFVPTTAYIDILEEKGISRTKLKPFRRRIDYNTFKFLANARDEMKTKLKINDGTYYLYAGRISQDKSLDLALDAFEEIQKKNENVYFVIVGDGPHLLALQARSRKNKNIIFTGRVKREELPFYYSACDLFVFPSETDTFGLVVLEAQACQLPVLVSNVGGPKEIISHKETGFIMEDQKMETWKYGMELFLQENHITEYLKSNDNEMLKCDSWDSLIDEISSSSQDHDMLSK